MHRRLNREASERLSTPSARWRSRTGSWRRVCSHSVRPTNTGTCSHPCAQPRPRRSACPGARDKDRSLRLVLEHARAGEESATALLERLGREGREARHVRDACAARAPRAHATARRPARGGAAARRLRRGFAVRARPGEIAQVLLNLARNALDGFVRRGRARGSPSCGSPRAARAGRRSSRCSTTPAASPGPGAAALPSRQVRAGKHRSRALSRPVPRRAQRRIARVPHGRRRQPFHARAAPRGCGPTVRASGRGTGPVA